MKGKKILVFKVEGLLPSGRNEIIEMPGPEEEVIKNCIIKYTSYEILFSRLV